MNGDYAALQSIPRLWHNRTGGSDFQATKLGHANDLRLACDYVVIAQSTTAYVERDGVPLYTAHRGYFIATCALRICYGTK